MRLDGMIFDLDGTLTDTFRVCFAAFREALRPITGRTHTDEEIMARFGPSEEGMLQRWVPDRWEECLRLYLSAYEREHRRIARTFPGVETALGRLKARGIRLAVVTGRGPHSTAISLRQFGLAPYFDRVEIGSPDGAIKPRCIRRVVAGWGVPAGRVAYLGDVPSDVEASRVVGVRPLVAAWDERSDADALRALNPLAVFETVPQFIEWIETTVETRAGAPAGSGAAGSPDPPPSRSGAGG